MVNGSCHVHVHVHVHVIPVMSCTRVGIQYIGSSYLLRTDSYVVVRFLTTYDTACAYVSSLGNGKFLYP